MKKMVWVLACVPLVLGTVLSAADEDYSKLKGFSPIETAKSDEAGKCVIKLLKSNLEKLGDGIYKNMTIKDVKFQNVFNFEAIVVAKHATNSEKREAYRRARAMKKGRYWNGLFNSSLYSVPIVLKRDKGSVDLQGFVRAYWDGNSECKLQFPEKKGKVALPKPTDLIKGFTGKSDELDALYISDLDHNIFFYVDPEKTGFLSKKYTLE